MFVTKCGLDLRKFAAIIQSPINFNNLDKVSYLDENYECSHIQKRSYPYLAKPSYKFKDLNLTDSEQTVMMVRFSKEHTNETN